MGLTGPRTVSRVRDFLSARVGATKHWRWVEQLLNLESNVATNTSRDIAIGPQIRRMVVRRQQRLLM